MTKIIEVITESKKEPKIYFAKQYQKKITKIEEEKNMRVLLYILKVLRKPNFSFSEPARSAGSEKRF